MKMWKEELLLICFVKWYLDSKPQTLTAQSHRPAYASDEDYFSKPNVEDVFEKVYAIMNEINPIKYPQLF